jgi:hypothetical protein
MATSNQPGALKTVGSPPLVPLRLLAVAAAEVGITGRALREALAVAVVPLTMREQATPLRQVLLKGMPAVLEADGPVSIIGAAVAVAQEVQESRELQLLLARVEQELVLQLLDRHSFTEEEAAAAFTQQVTPRDLAVLASVAPALVMPTKQKLVTAKQTPEAAEAVLATRVAKQVQVLAVMAVQELLSFGI